MKKIFFAVFLLTAILSGSAKAQIKLSLNLDLQPDWGPTGYDHVDYYYLPDIDCYYDVAHKQFVYPNGSSWARSSSLPSRYASYNLYNSYKVVVNSPTPYLHDATYKSKYASYKGHKSQPVIRDSHDTKYSKAKTNHSAPSAPSHAAPQKKDDNRKGDDKKGGDKGHDDHH